jgi:hypothetical protein
LQGEWYALKLYERDGRMRWNLKKRKVRRRASLAKMVPVMLRLLIALAISGTIAALSLAAIRERAFLLFPSMDRSAIDMMVVVLQLTGALLLFFLYRKARDPFDLLFNALIPPGAMLAVESAARIRWVWLILLAGIVATWFLVRCGSILLDVRSWTVASRVRAVLVILSCILFLVTNLGGMDIYIRGGLLSDISEISDEERQAIEEEFDARCKDLDSDIWATLTTQEKLDLLQYICDYESRFTLGCGPVWLCAGDTGDESIQGTYNSQTRIVTIQTEHLEEDHAAKVLETTLHELRHAYQRDLVDMYDSLESFIRKEYRDMLLFKQMRAFSEEFENYHSGDEDFQAYYDQAVEEDSRYWAYDRMAEIYYDAIYDFSTWD